MYRSSPKSTNSCPSPSADGQLGLLTERPAAVQRAHLVAFGVAAHARQVLRAERRPVGVRRGQARGLIQIARHLDTVRLAASVAPSRHATTGLPVRAAASSTRAETSGAGGLLISTIVRVDGSAPQQFQGVQRGDAANALVQVAAAGADRVADAHARARQETWSLPGYPCPMRRPDRSAPRGTTLAKPRPTPFRIAVPQSGPITSRFLSRARCFKSISSSEGDVVREQEHVQTRGEGLAGFGGRVRAGDGDHGQVCAGLRYAARRGWCAAPDAAHPRPEVRTCVR